MLTEIITFSFLLGAAQVPSACGNPPPHTSVNGTNQSAARDPEVASFGRKLVLSDAPQCNFWQIYNLTLLAAQYRIFGQNRDAERISEIILSYHEAKLKESPSDANIEHDIEWDRLSLALVHAQLGQAQELSDLTSKLLARAESKPDDPVYRHDIFLLAEAMASVGAEVQARNLADRFIRLSKGELDKTGYVPDESPSTVQELKECDALIQQMNALIQKGVQSGNASAFEEIGKSRDRAAQCFALGQQELYRDQAQGDHMSALVLVASSSLALSDESRAISAMNSLLSAPASYRGGQIYAMTELAKISKERGDGGWLSLAREARRYAKLDIGIHDEFSPYPGHVDIFDIITPDQVKKAGIEGSSLVKIAQTELLLGRPEVALTYLRPALISIEYANASKGTVSINARFLMGEALLDIGATSEALAYLRSASRDADGFFATTRDSRQYAVDATDVHMAYLEAALRADDKDAAAEALLRAGRSQIGRSLEAQNERMSQDMDNISEAQEAARTATEADLALANQIARGAHNSELAKLQQMAMLRDAEAERTLQLLSDKHGSYQLFGLEPIADFKSIQARLPSNAAALIIAVGSNRGFEAVLTSDSSTIQRIELGRSNLLRAIVRLRQSTEFRQSGGKFQLPEFDRKDARLLFQALITPIKASLRGKTRLYVSRSEPIDQVPLSLLFDAKEQAWLADEFATSIVLDPSVLALSRSTNRPHQLGALAVAGPDESSADFTRNLILSAPVDESNAATSTEQAPPLPGALEELDAVIRGASTKQSILLKGTDATESAFLREATKDYTVISIAAHAGFDRNAYPVPRPAMQLFWKTKKGKARGGLLYAQDIEGIRLRADTVILSGCETGAGSGRPGSEALSGLAQAFLYAGARTILATQWDVDSDSASMLMSKTMSSSSRSGDIAVELQRAMKEVRSQQGFSHPIYWAPYLVVDTTIH